MLLQQRREPFDGDRWLFEPKWDGWRCIAAAHGGRASLYSRNGNDLTRRFPSVAAALASLPAGTVLDGELVILDPDGCPDFSALMRRQGAPCLLAFDMLAERGRDICEEPVEDRKARLRDVTAGLDHAALQNTDWIAGEGRALFGAVRARGMEGIVAKRLGSRYAPGQRSGAWVKIKVPGYAPDRAEWFRNRQQRGKVCTHVQPLQQHHERRGNAPAVQRCVRPRPAGQSAAAPGYLPAV